MYLLIVLIFPPPAWCALVQRLKQANMQSSVFRGILIVYFSVGAVVFSAWGRHSFRIRVTKLINKRLNFPSLENSNPIFPISVAEEATR